MSGAGVALAQVETIARGIAVALGIATLGVAIGLGVVRGSRRPVGRTVGEPGVAQRTPYLMLVSVLWIGACILLWRPFPVAVSAALRVAALAIGVPVCSLGIALYLWGARTLGQFFRVSSGLGLQLDAEHRLITDGPFARIRHPMYLGLQLAALGGLLLFQRWTMAFVLINFAGLVLRARREEEALAAEFGEAWEVYAHRVPAWLPRLGRTR